MFFGTSLNVKTASWEMNTWTNIFTFQHWSQRDKLLTSISQCFGKYLLLSIHLADGWLLLRLAPVNHLLKEAFIHTAEVQYGDVPNSWVFIQIMSGTHHNIYLWSISRIQFCRSHNVFCKMTHSGILLLHSNLETNCGFRRICLFIRRLFW